MLSPENLRCCNLIDPLSIDELRPRLSWTLTAQERNKQQSAYRILVASSPELLATDHGDLWDSGRVPSSQSAQIEYNGDAMVSFRRHFWKVAVWDEQNVRSDWSRSAEWSAGVLHESDWAATWIAHSKAPLSSGPLPRFRSGFTLEDKPIVRALLYSSGVGFHEMFLNGQKVGEDVLAPLWSNYRKTVFYVTHEVSTLLQKGENVIASELGNGFYNVAGGRYYKFIGSFGRLMLKAMLRIEYSDGSTTLVGSTGEWKSCTGPTTFSCINGGEDFDARLDQSGWNNTGFDDGQWRSNHFDSQPGGELRAQQAAPIRVMETLVAKEFARYNDGRILFDFARNFAGWPCFRVRGKAGSCIRLQTSESLDETGTKLDNTSATGGEDAQIAFSYTLKGDGEECWHPRFSYTGFRYGEVTITGELEILSITGHFIHSSTPRAGSFSCSNALFNRIDQLVDNAVRSNFQAVLTDCPHREKLGWQEVGYLMGPSILYHFDAERFFEKIVRDAAEGQLDNGLVPDVCPEYVVFRGPFRDSPEWGSSVVILPWMLYRWRGDKQVLQRFYPTMVRYVDYLSATAQNGIVRHGLGDWFDIGPGEPGASKLTPAGVTGTATYFHNLTIVSQTATLLGKDDDARRYQQLAQDVCRQFNEQFFDTTHNYYASGSQTAQAMPLVFGMVPEKHRNAVVAQLINDVVSRGNQQTAGDIGFRYMIRALADAGRSDILYQMNTRTNKPSYGCQIENGVTSLAEAWDGNPKSSQNHCMLGHIQEWFMSSLLGITQEDDSLGFERIAIKPAFPEGLNSAAGHYDSIRGRIESAWQVQGTSLSLRVVIPANTSARICLPSIADNVRESGRSLNQAFGVSSVKQSHAGCDVYVGSGEYHFNIDLLPPRQA